MTRGPFARNDGRTTMAEGVTIGGDYLAAMTTPLLAGRGFRPLGLQRSDEIILSRRAVETLLDGVTASDAIGRRM